MVRRALSERSREMRLEDAEVLYGGALQGIFALNPRGQADRREASANSE
jgi:hypothetical protein